MAERGNVRWTVRDVLVWTEKDFRNKGFTSPRLDAEVLLAHVLGCDRLGLYLHFDRPLNPPERAEFRKLVARRREGVPAAYLTGHKEFWSLDFLVEPGVLVPRPETELVVEEAIREAAGLCPVEGAPAAEGKPLLAADVGTGSGCIAIALAREVPSLLCLAIDRSPVAVDIAARNAARHGVDGRVRPVRGDLLAMVAKATLDLVVSNPPYVPEGGPWTADRDVLRHEPKEALLAGREGLDVFGRLLPEVARVLRADGRCVLEMGAGQAAAVAALGEHAGLHRTRVARDLAGIERVVVLRKP